MATRARNQAASNNNTFIIIGAIVAAVAVGILLIVVSSGDTSLGADIDYSEIPTSRTSDGGFILGDPEAPITIVAFEDFLCPHCQSYQPTIKEFIAQYVATGQAKFEYRMLPAVDPTYSAVAASLAECTSELGGSFWEAHDLLFTIASSQRFNDTAARNFAERIGIPYAQLLDCQPDALQYQTDQALAREIGVTGTPTVLVRIGDGAPQRGLVSSRPALSEMGNLVAQYNS